MSFTYDAYGNQTGARDSAGGLTTSAYDWADRLTSVTPPGGPATSYTLDALGRPWTRTTGASVDTYAYLGSTTTAWQIANAGGGGTTTSSALDATGARTAIAGASLTGYLAFDLHGNLVAAESGSKVITDALRYDAWGEVLASTTSALPTPWRYQGRLDLSPDAANPLYDYGARAYRPVQGTFTSLDTYAGTVIDPLSMNRFLYAEANPATLIDPDGHIALETTSGTGAPIYQQPTISPHGAELPTDTYSCNDCVTVPKSVAPYDNDPFTGYNPWALKADPTLQAIKDRLYDNCTTPSDPGCDAIIELADWEAQNRQLYCFTHRAECEDAWRRDAHFELGVYGTVPFFGIPFNVLDAGLYGIEGDVGGAGFALASSVPVAGAVARWGRFGVRVLHGAEEAESALHLYGSADGYLYQYVGEGAQWARMQKRGLSTLYLTPAGDLSPLQAGIELALPTYNTAGRVIRIPVSVIPPDLVVRQGRVAGNVFGRGGGGWEVVLGRQLPLDLFEVVQ